MRNLVGLVLTLTCVACVGPKSQSSPLVVRNISFPPIGTQVTVPLGDPMVDQGTESETPGIELTEKNAISGYTLSPGFYPMTADDGDVTYHSFRIGDSLGDGYGALKVGFLVDPPKNIQASRSEQKICVVTAFGLKTCDTEHPYRRIVKSAISADGFRQTLIYSGRSGSKINIAYREFSGSVARPAFSNSVEYDLTVSDTIAYKGARLKVIKATNEDITFQLISNFNTQ